MTVVTQNAAPRAQKTDGGLYDILELILDRGLVIDVFIRVSVIGIEILRVDIRVVVASVDTYLRFAEACNRLDLENRGSGPLPAVVGGTAAGIQNVSHTALTHTVDTVDALAESVAPASRAEEQAAAVIRTTAKRKGEA